MIKTKLLYILISLFFVGCHSFHIEKRKHRKGYSFHSKTTPKQHEGRSNSVNLKIENTADNTIGKDTPKHVQETIGSSNSFFEKDSTPFHLNDTNSKKNTINSDAVIDFETIVVLDNPNTSKEIEIQQKERTDRREESSRNYAMFYFLLAVIVPFLFFNKKSERISRWSKNNVKKGRWLIAFGVIGVLIISLVLGHLFRYTVTPWMIFFSIGMILFSLIGYFISSKKRISSVMDINGRKLYRERLIFTNLFNVSSGFGAFALGTKGFLSGFLNLTNWHFLDGWINFTSNTISDTNEEMQTLILAVKALLMLVLIFLLVIICILSCYIYCTFSAGAAIIVLIGGLAVTLTGFILTFLWLKRIRYLDFSDIDNFIRYKRKLFIVLLILVLLLIAVLFGTIYIILAFQ